MSKTPAQKTYDRARDVFIEGSAGNPKRLLRGDAIDAFVELALVNASLRTVRIADELRQQAIDYLKDHQHDVGPRVAARFAAECHDKGAQWVSRADAIPLHLLWDSMVNELVFLRQRPERAHG
jgi:hypothetical protein